MAFRFFAVIACVCAEKDGDDVTPSDVPSQLGYKKFQGQNCNYGQMSTVTVTAPRCYSSDYGGSAEVCSNKVLATCKAACDAKSDCIAFEYHITVSKNDPGVYGPVPDDYIGSCFLQGTCSEADLVANSNKGWVMFLKECPTGSSLYNVPTIYPPQYAQLNRACPAGYAIKSTDKSNTAKSNCCEDKGKCAANDIHMCIPCKAGQHPDHNECRTNKCQCENGLGATAAACSSNGAQQCSSCDQGYWLHGTACKINKCHCMDGRGFRGKGCPSHHATKCEKCVEDYHIVGITCVEDDVLAMADATCHCLNGRGARGANCPRHNASICESCAEGHHLLGFTCVEDVEELSLVEEVTAPLTKPAAVQLDEPDLNEPEGLHTENEHKESKSTRLLDNEVARGVTYGLVGAAVGSVATVAVMSFHNEKKLSEPLLA